MGKRYQADLRGFCPGFTYNQYNRGFVFLSFKPCQQLQSPTPNLHRVETRMCGNQMSTKNQDSDTDGFLLILDSKLHHYSFSRKNISSYSHNLTGTMPQYEQFTYVWKHNIINIPITSGVYSNPIWPSEFIFPYNQETGIGPKVF